MTNKVNNKKTTTKKETTKKVATKKTETKKPATKKVVNKKVKEVKPIKKETSKKVISKKVEETKIENNKVEKIKFNNIKIKLKDLCNKFKFKNTCLPCKRYAIIASFGLALVLIITLITVNAKTTYKLSEILSCYYDSDKTISLKNKYMLSDDSSIYVKNGKYLEIVGGLACYSDSEDNFKSLTDEVKGMYESAYEFETHDFDCLYFNYADSSYSLDYVFMYDDDLVIQIVMKNTSKDEIISIAKSIK